MYTTRETVGLASTTILCGISVFFIVLRNYVRGFMLHNLGIDDIFCTIGGILNVVEQVFMFYEVKAGSGLHMQDLSLEQIRQQRLWTYISIQPYTLSLFFIKVSIIFLYRRVFSSTVRTLSTILLAVITSTTLVWVFLSAFQCSPASGFWELSLGAKCLNLSNINFAFIAVNAVTDIALIALPLPTFSKLRLRKAEKRALIAIFALGGFAALTCILRIPYVYTMSKGSDPAYNGFGVVVWTRVELSISVICACLPCLRVPLARYFPRTWGTKRSTKGGSDPKQSASTSWRSRMRRSRNARFPGGSRLGSGDEERGVRDENEESSTTEMTMTMGDLQLNHQPRPISPLAPPKSLSSSTTPSPPSTSSSSSHPPATPPNPTCPIDRSLLPLRAISPPHIPHASPPQTDLAALEIKVTTEMHQTILRQSELSPWDGETADGAPWAWPEPQGLSRSASGRPSGSLGRSVSRVESRFGSRGPSRAGSRSRERGRG